MCYVADMETTQTYTRKEVADILKVSLSTIGLMVSAKRIYYVRVGRSIRIPTYAVEDYLNGRAPRWPDDPMTEDSGDVDPTPSLFAAEQAKPLRVTKR